MTNQKNIVDLQLTDELLESGIIEYLTFDPRSKQGTLKLNGVHDKIPAIIFPLTLEYNEIKKEDIENLQNQLQKLEIESSDIINILEILYLESNKDRIIDAIKEYHRQNLSEEETAEEEDNEQEEYDTVSSTIRKHFGTAKPKGTISGISRVFKAISRVSFYCNKCKKIADVDLEPPVFSFAQIDAKCDRCNNYPENEPIPFYKNTICVELQDIETFNDMDRLTVYLFDEYTEEARVGELVTITGNIKITYAGKRLGTILYGESVQYLNKENFTLSREDFKAIRKFARNDFDKKYEGSIIDKLVSIFDTSIVGYEYVKKGLLMSAVNTSDDITKKERINVLLIGDPALAKSKLAKRVTKLIPNSRHESGQSSTGKSLTAIIEKTDDNTFLRPGPIPLAKGAICSINELGRQSMEDQGQLLDVMEEGEFTKNAFGKNVRIRAPTTIVATANPVNNSKWRENDKVDLTEFPVLEPVRDRFDLKFIFKDKKEDAEIRKFADELTEIEDKKDNGRLADYTSFLIKYIQYAKQIQPKINEEGKIMLKEFYIEIRSKNFGSPRVLITLRKLAKAIARLKLKEIADEEDAEEVMNFYNFMLLNFQKQVVISRPLKIIAYEHGKAIVHRFKETGIVLEELFEIICKENDQLASYFGYGIKSLQIKFNHKIRTVYELLLNYPHIKKVQDHPVVLKWIDDPGWESGPGLISEQDFSVGDVGDVGDKENCSEKNETVIEDNEKNIFSEKPMSLVSPVSPDIDEDSILLLSSTDPGPEQRRKDLEQKNREEQGLQIKWWGSNWICNNCNLTGDRFFMQCHPCKYNIKNNFEKVAERSQYENERWR